MMKCGCIGKKLTHSFSKEIHARLADYSYELIELSEEQIPAFFERKDFDAINVTIPYKQTVIPYLDDISDVAARIGAVNTIVNRDGRLSGYNTDYYGMKALIEKAGVDLAGKKVLLLGTGGTSKTARVLAADLGAAEILTVSRRTAPGTITYAQAAQEHADAQIIINTTPSGMYPDCDASPIDISAFTNLQGVIDAIYNPLSTNLILDAKARGIKAEGGLYMLVMQAVVAVEKFLDRKIAKDDADRVFSQILASKENIVLTGMPGSGKSTVGHILESTGFSLIDTDEEIEARCGCSVQELINTKGEAFFRDLESEIIREASSTGQRIIASGGGGVLRAENVNRLRRNGKLYFLNADISRLHPTDSRPLADTQKKLEDLLSQRDALYRSVADVIVPDLETPEEKAAFILRKRMEMIL